MTGSTRGYVKRKAVTSARLVMTRNSSELITKRGMPRLVEIKTTVDGDKKRAGLL